MNKQLTYDDTRDLSIKILDKLVENDFVKNCIDTNDETEFEIQDIIHSELNTFFDVKED